MARQTRDIVRIDEDLCDGCGQCVLSCAEGAIQIIDGKAKLVSDTLCDGFGACLGSCPQDAITIIKREAEVFDEEAVKGRLRSTEKTAPKAEPAGAKRNQAVAVAVPGPTPVFPAVRQHQPHPSGCPGSAMRMFAAQSAPAETAASSSLPSQLTQWPVQLMLVPPTAPFLQGREILLAADCCPFAYADFHNAYLRGKALLVGCPKLDDISYYRQKMEQIIRESGCTGLTVMIMEVPCCGGLQVAAREALRAAGRSIPLKEVVVGIRGDILRETSLAI